MLCCSDCCPKYKDCARACINAEYKNRLDQVEGLYTYGSCSIQYVNGEVKLNEHYICGPTSNYAMFIPKISPEYDKVFKKFKELQGHQITIDEWIEEKEKQDKEKPKMNDSLDVTVKITDYNKYPEAKFPHVTVKSVFTNDELVEIIGENGLSVKVAASEITKAVERCSHNRW